MTTSDIRTYRSFAEFAADRGIPDFTARFDSEFEGVPVRIVLRHVPGGEPELDIVRWRKT